MLKLTVLVVFFYSLIGTTISTTYTCWCYCPSSNTYAGTAYSNTCSSSACQSACYSGLSSCTSLSYTYGTCSSSSSGSGGSGSSWVSDSYSTVLSAGTIIGTVVGCLSGLAVLVVIIVIMVILCKRKKRAQIWAIQAQQRAVIQPSFINGPGQQQFAYNTYQYPPPAAPMNNVNWQYPPPYSSTQPVRIQT